MQVSGTTDIAGTLTIHNGILGDGNGLSNLQLRISGTNATPPVSASTIKAWVNVTLPDGNLFKMPLYL